MTLDEISGELLEKIYNNGGSSDQFSLMNSGNYTSHYTPGVIFNHMVDNQLITVNNINAQISITLLGKEIVESGGWRRHLENQKAETKRREKIADMGAMGSHISGKYAFWGFWMAFVSLIFSMINFICPGLLQRLISMWQ